MAFKIPILASWCGSPPESHQLLPVNSCGSHIHSGGATGMAIAFFQNTLSWQF